MANNKNKRKQITQKREYKKEKALILMSFSYLLELSKISELKININECKTKYDLILYKVYKWMINLRTTFATKKIANYIEIKTSKMYKKYYPNDLDLPKADVINVSLLFYYIYIEFHKHNNLKVFIPPVKSEEVIEFLDWYNENDPFPKEIIIFCYRVALSLDPSKKSVIKLKSVLGSLYGDVNFEDITNEQNN